MTNNKLYTWITGMLVVGSILLAACEGGTSLVTPTVQPTILPSLQPTNLPSGQPTHTPAATAGQPDSGNAAAQQALKALASQLNLDPAAVKIMDVQVVQWPDTCLGVHIQGQMCAQHIVPGFNITLDAKGQPYEIHTNQDGSSIINVPGLSITWTSGSQCELAVIRQNEGVSFGPCGGEMSKHTFPARVQEQDFLNFTTKYAPFYAETPAGTLGFAGIGVTIATPPEQRMIAEWSRSVADEASGGRIGAAYGLAFAWHRQGGVANYCDDLAVYITGEVDASLCKGGQVTNLGRIFMNSEQLKQMYTWIDTLKPFSIEQSDQASQHALAVDLIFDGKGNLDATPAEQQAIVTFSENLYAQMSAAQGNSGPSLTPTPTVGPSQVVGDFLTSLRVDPSGKNSLKYLSQPLQTAIQNGQTIPGILGIQNMYRTFGVTTLQIDRANGLAFVDANLNYVSPIQRDFQLILENGAWRIDTVISYAVPTQTISPYYKDADLTILNYVQALRNGQPADAWGLLSSDAQLVTSAIDLENEIKSIQQISVTSLTLLTAQTDQLTFKATIWVTPAQGQTGPWKAGSNTRWIVLSSTDQGWRISNISDTPIP